MKTHMSRFTIHDEESAPQASTPILKGALSSAGQLPNLLGVLAGSPATLRAYARFRSELRNGTLEGQTLERISLAVAEYHRSEPGLVLHERTARQAGLGLDEIARAKAWRSSDPAHHALLQWLKAIVHERGKAPLHLHEQARESGWEDAQLLEAVAFLSLEAFTALVNVAGDVPVDGSREEARQLRAVA